MDDRPASHLAGPRRQTTRRCLASGQLLPKSQLLRLVVAPDGVLVPDVAGDLPGRGLWILPAADMIARAQKKKLFARAAKSSITVSDNLAAEAEALLLRRALDCISLAKRAGQLVAGFEKAKAWIQSDRAAVLLQACDGADEGKRKLRDLAKKRSVACLLDDLFERAALGRMVGRDEAVHIAIASGGLADRLLAEAARIRLLRGQTPQDLEAPQSLEETSGPDEGQSDSAQLRKVSE